MGARTLRGVIGWILAAVVGAGQESQPADVTGEAVKEIEPGLVHDWWLIDDLHWEVAASNSEAASASGSGSGATLDDGGVPDGAGPAGPGSCARGMAEVRGRMKTFGAGDLDVIDDLQKTACSEWMNTSFPERCRRFDRSAWLALSARLPTEAMGFCIDRFEYPNEPGENPWIVVSASEAKALCEREGKRLCTEKEWTFACEGEEAMPYPYGYERDPEACVVDRPWLPVDERALSERTGARALRELDRLWQGEPSGARPRCGSPFGVHDLTGNVDEWTTSVRPGEGRPILKGGYWGPVRNRCRPSTRAHGEGFVYYQQGFRCCADLRPADDAPGARD